METLLREASAFWFTWNKTEESHSYRRAYLKRVCRLRFSFFANDFDCARAPCRPLAWRSARARHEPRRPVGLARLCLEADDHLRLGLRACSSVG